MRAAAAVAVIGLTAVGLAVAAPVPHAQPRLTTDPDLSKSDAVLLKTEDLAIAEFQRRLRDQVRYRDGLLVIRDSTASGTSVVPATIMWMIDCSDGGLAVTFGSGTGDTDNGVSIQLTGASVSDDACTRIAPAVGQTMLAITKGE